MFGIVPIDSLEAQILKFVIYLTITSGCLIIVILLKKLMINIYKNKLSKLFNKEPRNVDESNAKINFTSGDNPHAAFSEYLVARYLSTLNSDDYIVMNDILIPSCNGNTTNTQIDHLVISRFGLFCIETKSHRGWIRCKKGSKTWTQILSKNCYNIYNPLLQNYAHTCAVKALIADELKSPIESIIVFTDADVIMNSEIRKVANVGNIGYLLRYIDDFDEPIYSIDECRKIAEIIRREDSDNEVSITSHRAEISNLVSSLT